jgi:AraC-like DNA-binding protein
MGMCEGVFIEQVRKATMASVAAGAPARIEEVAAVLFVSRSTLQRRLAAGGTSFTEIRREARVRVALCRLTSGSSCARTAREVGLSGDHLCRLITLETGVRPRDIARACELATRARRWRRATPPRSGTRLYAERRSRWRALEAELQELLEPISASGHPLSAWAHRMRRAGRRPDFRRGVYRARARSSRRKERTQRAAERRRAHALLEQLLRNLDVSPSLLFDDVGDATLAAGDQVAAKQPVMPEDLAA